MLDVDKWNQSAAVWCIIFIHFWLKKRWCRPPTFPVNIGQIRLCFFWLSIIRWQYGKISLYSKFLLKPRGIRHISQQLICIVSPFFTWLSVIRSISWAVLMASAIHNFYVHGEIPSRWKLVLTNHFHLENPVVFQWLILKIENRLMKGRLNKQVNFKYVSWTNHSQF